jgi:hypothetical protein
MSPIHTKVEGDKLVITVDMSKAARGDARVSSSGKTKLLASTGGFTISHGDVKVSLNATIPA